MNYNFTLSVLTLLLKMNLLFIGLFQKFKSSSLHLSFINNLFSMIFPRFSNSRNSFTLKMFKLFKRAFLRVKKKEVKN